MLLMVVVHTWRLCPFCPVLINFLPVTVVDFLRFTITQSEILSSHPSSLKWSRAAISQVWCRPIFFCQLISSLVTVALDKYVISQYARCWPFFLLSVGLSSFRIVETFLISSFMYRIEQPIEIHHRKWKESVRWYTLWKAKQADVTNHEKVFHCMAARHAVVNRERVN